MKKLLSLLFILLGIAIGWYFRGDCNSKPLEGFFGSQAERHNNDQFPFINQLLECEGAGEYKELKSFKYELVERVANLKKQGKVLEASVYFRDLDNGPWYGVNEHENFKPASLLKLPVMIAYFKKAETDLDLLNQTIVYKSDGPASVQNIPPSKRLEIGKTYTVEELIRRMIVYSDNEALKLLQQHQNGIIAQVYIDLNLPLAIGAGFDDLMNVKDYASFFRILYNSSYMSQYMSNRALTLLSEVEFKAALPAGVPDTLTVSHKFGEWEIASNVQLHDCGVIYYPKKPYLLCVMTRGNNINDLIEAIKNISTLVYQKVEFGLPY